MHLDLSDLPELASSIIALVKAIRDAKSSDSEKGKRISRAELVAILKAFGGVIVAAADCLV